MISANMPQATGLWDLFLESRDLFGPKKLAVKLQSACFEKLIFLHVFNIRKNKRIAKFEGLEPRRFEGIKAIVAPEIGPKSFGTFEKQAPCQVFIGASTSNSVVSLSTKSKWRGCFDEKNHSGHNGWSSLLLMSFRK